MWEVSSMTRTAGPRTSKTVLIVEDDPDDAFLIERALIRAAAVGGTTVDLSRFGDGWEAIRAVGRRDVVDDLPDFVVVDLNMPVMDGLRFLKVLRSELKLPKLPAFVLTTSDRPEIHAAAYEMGADCVFQKPDTHAGYVELAQLMFAAANFHRAVHGATIDTAQPA
jgi:CheY-like chemotaxis protein